MTIEVSPEIALKVMELIAGGGDKPGSMPAKVREPIRPVGAVPVNAAPTQSPGAYQTVSPSFQQPAAPVQTNVSAAPTSAPAYTIEQLQTAIAPLLDAGKVAQIQQLVQSFGVGTLMDIPKERYGEFANGLRQLGGVL